MNATDLLRVIARYDELIRENDDLSPGRDVLRDVATDILGEVRWEVWTTAHDMGVVGDHDESPEAEGARAALWLLSDAYRAALRIELELRTGSAW